MPATYAHIIMARYAAFSEEVSFYSDAKVAFENAMEYVYMGAVSPDYPYLGLEKSWADRMHYESTGDIIIAGVNALRSIDNKDPFGSFGHCLSWMLGYTAHVVGDVTIHPVVMELVGPYAGNETAHRLCEIDQDAYVFLRMNIGEIAQAEIIKTGIKKCTNADAILNFWDKLLKDTYSQSYQEDQPQIHLWNSLYCEAIDNFAEENKFLVLSVLARKMGYAYPVSSDVKSKHIRALTLPNNHGIADYDVVFDKAVSNVAQMWKVVIDGVYGFDDQYLKVIRNWDLDTGKYQDQFEYWR